MTGSRRGWWLAAGLVALAGCQPQPLPEDAHQDPALPETAGRRSRVQSDLPPQAAQDIAASLDALEDLLDAAFPFLPAPAEPPRTLVIADPARYTLHAREHGVEGTPGAFVCAQGEVHLLWRAEDWEPFGPPFPLEPRCRPLAAATFRRRLLQALGPKLRPTWLEDGLAQAFVELAAHELGEGELMDRSSMRRLLDAFLPLWLGEPPVLRELVSLPPDGRRRRVSADATAWAVARHLLARPGGPRVIHLALRHHAGLEGPPPGPPPEAAPADWAAAVEWLKAEEPAFQRGLMAALLRELLVSVATAPTPVDRWEAAGALRLVGNLDLDADQPDQVRQQMVRSAEHLLRENAPPARFLELFQAEIERAATFGNRLAAARQVRARAVRELERRAQGFGHPALEQGRLNLGRVIERAVEAAAADAGSN